MPGNDKKMEIPFSSFSVYYSLVRTVSITCFLLRVPYIQLSTVTQWWNLHYHLHLYNILSMIQDLLPIGMSYQKHDKWMICQQCYI